MSFLNPAILLGLFAAAIPIIFHFLNLRKVKRIEFSSIKFLKELQQTKIKRLKFKQWLLLLLRVLIIVSIVMAFARPTIQNKIITAESSVKKNVIFILDNSLSMSALEEKGSLINQAKKAIDEVVEYTSASDNLYLITTTSDSVKLISNTNKNSILEQVEETESNDIKGNLNKAIEKAFNVSKESNRYFSDIYLISDFQKLIWILMN